MGRWAFTAVGIFTLTILAAGLTELTISYGRQGELTDDSAAKVFGLRQKTLINSPHPVTPLPTIVVTPTPIVVASPVPSVVPTPATAITNSFVHLRASASTLSTILAGLNGNTTVTLEGSVSGGWQQVMVGGQTGYVDSSYLTYTQ